LPGFSGKKFREKGKNLEEQKEDVEKKIDVYRRD